MSCRVNLIFLLPRGLRSCRCKVRPCYCKVFCYKVRYFLLPLSLFLLLKARFCYCKVFLLPVYVLERFQPVLVLVMLSSSVLILKSSGTLVLSPAPLKKWIRSPLSLRSFRFDIYVRRQVPRKKASFMRCEFTVFENAADPLPSGRPAKFPGQ